MGSLTNNNYTQQDLDPTTDQNIIGKTNQLVLVLVNPHSGRGKSVTIYKKKLLPFLELNNIQHEVFITDSKSRVYDYLQNVDIYKFKSIIVVSGDGLLHEAVNSLMSRDDWKKAISVPIGVIPTGSGNGMAYTLLRQDNLIINNEVDAIRICCEQAIQDSTSLTDMVRITYNTSIIWSFLSVGWGLLAEIDIDSEWLRRFGEIRFTIYGLLRSLTSTSYRGKISFKISPEHKQNYSSKFEAKEEKASISTFASSSQSTVGPQNWIHIEDKFVCLYAVYQSHVSSVTNFSPKSTLTDQLIYLTFIRGELGLCRIIEFLLAIKDGSHENLPYVTVVPVTTFRFQPLEPTKIVVDGEVISWSLNDGPLTAEVVPKVLKLCWSRQ